MTFARVTRRKRNLATAGAVLFATAGTALFLGPQAHAATSGTGTSQTVTFTPSALLTITASPASLPSVSVGSSVPLSLGSVVVQDTEQDSTTWTASVAASNCFPPTVQTGSTATNVLPASAITLNPGPAATPVSLSTSPVSSTPGTGGAFTDPTTTGSTTAWTYGTAQTLASAAPSGTDALSNDGTYTLTPSLSLNLSGTSGFLAVPSTYTCSLQYTITG